MATPEDAEQAISKLNGTSVDGRTIQVERAKSPGAGGGERRGGGGGGKAAIRLLAFSDAAQGGGELLPVCRRPLRRFHQLRDDHRHQPDDFPDGGAHALVHQRVRLGFGDALLALCHVISPLTSRARDSDSRILAWARRSRRSRRALA